MRSHHFSTILRTTEAIANGTTADLLQLLKTAICEADLVTVNEVSATFSPQGLSAVLILAESHVALHVWSESRKATVDIHVCDYQQDNFAKAETLAALLAKALTGCSDRTQWSYTTISG